MVGQCLLKRVGDPKLWRKFHGRYWSGRFNGRILQFLFPDTFMNDSGRSVSKAINGLGLNPDRLVLVHDDIDLAFGTLRIRLGGASGGHLGLRSVIDELGTGEFIRVKLGVGRPLQGMDPAEFVVSEFDAHEESVIAELIVLAANAVIELTYESLDQVMSRHSGRSLASCD